MNKTWQSFLGQQGAKFDKDGRTEFKGAAPEISAAASSGVLADLSHLVLVQVSGVDAQTFLLNQLTNDLRVVDKQHSQLSAYCTPKGRMLAIFRIYANDSGYLLQMPSAIADSIVNRLRMYVMRAKVTLEISDELVCVGLAGPQAEEAVKSIAGDMPQHVNDTVQHNGMLATRLPGDSARFTVIGDTETMQSTWQQLAQTLTSVGSAAWSWLEIKAGQPVVLTETSEAFVPQMANLDLIDGINFKKGCYPGQEIVARMQYLGKLKKRMICAHTAATTTPQAGDNLFAPGFRDQSVGIVVDAQLNPKSGYDLLAVAKLDAIEANEMHLGAADGPTLNLIDLPYALSSTTES